MVTALLIIDLIVGLLFFPFVIYDAIKILLKNESISNRRICWYMLFATIHFIMWVADDLKQLLQ